MSALTSYPLHCIRLPLYPAPRTPYPRSDCRRVAREARLVVATSEGLVYVFALDTAEGGECALLRTHRLADTALAPRPPSEGTCAPQ